MAAAQTSEHRKVTQLRTPQRAGADADPAVEEILQEEETPAPRASKVRMAAPNSQVSRRRVSNLFLPVLLIGSTVLAGGAYMGLKAVTQHGVMVPYVNDHVAPPADTNIGKPALGQFAFSSGPALPAGSPHSPTQETAQKNTPAGIVRPGAEQQGMTHAEAPLVGEGGEHVSSPALSADSQAAMILDLAHQIAAVKAQNEKISADLSEAKKALTTLVTESAGNFGVVNGALSEIRHRVDRIDDRLPAPAASDPAAQPVTPVAAPVTPTASLPRRTALAVSSSQPVAVNKPVAAPSVARRAYHVLSGSPTIALIAGPDGQGRMVHPAGVEAPGDDHLAGWGAVRELRQVGESWEVVTEHGVIH